MSKNNSPGPVSYNTQDAYLNKTSMSPSGDRGGRFYGISKKPKDSFFDDAIKEAKKKPGVGKYDPHIALDKISRPMRGTKNC
jgi:hypothetical protein